MQYFTLNKSYMTSHPLIESGVIWSVNFWSLDHHLIEQLSTSDCYSSSSTHLPGFCCCWSVVPVHVRTDLNSLLICEGDNLLSWSTIHHLWSKSYLSITFSVPAWLQSVKFHICREHPLLLLTAPTASSEAQNAAAPVTAARRSVLDFVFCCNTSLHSPSPINGCRTIIFVSNPAFPASISSIHWVAFCLGAKFKFVNHLFLSCTKSSWYLGAAKILHNILKI